jgi:hypothetical protein
MNGSPPFTGVPQLAEMPTGSRRGVSCAASSQARGGLRESSRGYRKCAMLASRAFLNTHTARAVASFFPSWMSRVRVSSPAPVNPSSTRSQCETRVVEDPRGVERVRMPRESRRNRLSGALCSAPAKVGGLAHAVPGFNEPQESAITAPSRRSPENRS